jgi:hypothetical protein
MKINQLNSNQIDVNISEALRYMGYKNNIVDNETSRLIHESIHELKEICQLKYIYHIYDITKENDNIIFENSLINIKSKDLSNLFKSSTQVAVMAATLGFEVEKRIRYYSMNNITKAVIFDACAASYIEALCNYIEDEIKELADSSGCNITYRYSPGYGDVPISHQESILTSLNAQKLIGLTVSDSSILIPRKSVTAFIGFVKGKAINKKSCSNCNLFGNCSYSNGGEKNCWTN